MSDQKDVQSRSPLSASSVATAAAGPASTRSELGAAALTLVLSLLLIDAAVETFLSAAPVRWWVAGAVAAYLGLTAVVWRASRDRFGWSMRATASLFVLLGALALTAWLPGGLTNGVRMLGQPTSTVLSAVSALAVGVAGLMLLRARFLPWWGRTALGLLAFYGVAAFVMGIIEGTSYTDLLHGESLWRRLPFGLRGAFFGLLVIVPVGLVVQAVSALKQQRIAQGRTWGSLQVVALAMSVALGTAGLRQAVETRREEGFAISERGPGLRRLTSDALALPVPRTLDLAHLQAGHFADALGKDTGRIFEFLRDQISYEAYSGALRGPRGTLVAMAGNAVDRASLLAAMLKRGDQTVRFVSGRLPQADATALVTSMWAERQRTTPDAALPELDPLLTATLNTLNSSVTHDFPLIRDLIRRAALHVSPDVALRIPVLVEEARQHYWVQVANGNDWIDLDPSFADAVPGRAYAPPTQTFDELPESLFHRIELSVRVEEYTEGKSASRELLRRSVRASELSAGGILFSHQPEGDRLRPVFVAETEVFTGEPFRSRPPATTGATGVFNQLSGIGTRHSVPIATAEYLDIDFVAPGGHRQHVVREVFDCIGEHRRSSGHQLEAAEIEQLASRSASEPAQMALDLFFTTGRLYAVDLLSPDTSGDSHEHDLRAGLRSISVGFGAVSDALTAREERPGKSPILFYPASPRLWIAAFSTSNGKGKLTLDLRSNGARAAAADNDAQDVFLARVSRGVISATVERLILAYLIDEAREQGDWEPLFSTSTVFERAREISVPSLLLPRDVASLDRAIPSDALATLQQLPAEYLVVAPQHAVSLESRPRFAWWQIDRATGETTAVTDDGLHGAVVEYQFVRSKTDTRSVGVTVWRDGRRIWGGVFRVGGQRIVRFMQIMARHGGRRLPPRTF